MRAFMIKIVRDFFASTAIAGSMCAHSVALAEPIDASAKTPASSASSPIQMSVREASIIIQTANRAADTLAIAGIVASMSPNEKITIGSASVENGLSKDACQKIKDLQSSMVNLETYKAAQQIMMASGHLTIERATRDLKVQSDLLEIAETLSPLVTRTCEELGIKNVLGLNIR